jgi:dienelactone hydrolase
MDRLLLASLRTDVLACLLTSVSTVIIAFSPSAQAEPVLLTAADGVKVFGDIQPAVPANAAGKAPLIVAFHQAGSSRAEYAPIAPRLSQAGFNVFTIDQRSGGDEFGGENQTVAELGRSASYGAALRDMEAALAWGKAKANGAPVLVWGSSYSDAFVFVLAAKRPADVQGVLAFLPGEYLSKQGAARTAAKKLNVPVFITQSSDKDEIDQSRRIMSAMTAVSSTDKVQFVPRKRGVHGSATLRADRNAAGSEEYRGAALSFLGRFKART